jgi:hypothetical protein
MGIVGKAFCASVAACACMCGHPAHAQEQPAASFSAPHGFALPGTRTYLGLNLGRGLTASATECPATVLICDTRDRSAQVYAGRMFDPHWGAEVGYVDTGRLLRSTGEARSQGLNLSLVGRTRIASLGVFGKVGTTYGRSSDTSVMGNAAAPGQDPGFGLSWGGGLSWDLSPRLSATFEWDNYELRAPGGPVRSTNLGLQYRY